MHGKLKTTTYCMKYNLQSIHFTSNKNIAL